MMKNQIKKIYIVLFLIILICYKFIPEITLKSNYDKINNITQIVKGNWGKFDNQFFSDNTKELDFYIIDTNENIMYISYNMDKQQENISLQTSIKNNDTIVDVYDKDNYVGKIVFINTDKEKLRIYEKSVEKYFFYLIAIFTILVSFIFLIIWQKLLKPLKELTNFANSISSGHLELPMKASDKSYIKDLISSLDIMREKLLVSQNNQNLIEKRKNELIATLSHDIRNPIASINATAELLSVQEENEHKRNKLYSIMQISEQINLLATNLHQSTMGEIDEFKLVIHEHPSMILEKMIKNSDYKNYVMTINIKPCLIKIDKNKTSQVFDNIINNSYKYAGTNIEVNSYYNDKFLRIIIKDYGITLDDNELSKIVNKFYRGKNTADKSGSGLGLYITNSIIKKGGGILSFEKSNNSFSVIIDLPLSI